MKIAFFLNTPAHVHLHKHTITELLKRGHRITVLAREYGDTLALLQELNIRYYKFAVAPKSKYLKLLTLPRDLIVAYRYLRKDAPDLLVDVGVYGAYSAFLLRRPCILFNDSEPTTVQFILLKPFVRAVLTPSSFSSDLGPKHLRINSYKELAYLHPNRFSPDPRIRTSLGVQEGEEYSVLRFNAFDALHDMGVKGFSLGAKRRLAKELEKYGKVFISSEAKLPPDLTDHILQTSKSSIHDVIAFAKLVVADTQTIVTEAGVLGTPAVRYNTFVGRNDMGNFTELEERYNLIFNFSNEDDAIDKAIEIMKRDGIKDEWARARARMISEKLDLTDFMVEYIESQSDCISRPNGRHRESH